MSVRHLQRQQVIRATLREAWKFFRNPRNLALLTPAALDFRTMSDPPEEVYAGLMIEYRLRPILGLPVTWLTEITQVVPEQMFVDEQRKGPYRIWHHEHHFADLGDGRVKVTDRVTYELPFGWLGNLTHPFLVAPNLRKIFAHREKVIGELFG